MANVPSGGICFDIGAHKGGWTYWMRKAVGKQGAIWAFEPQPTLHGYLDGIFSGNYWENVTLEHLALSNQIGTVEIFVPGGEDATSPGASLKQHVLEHEQEVHSTKVNAMPLEAYVEKNDIKSVDFIKLDVEGSELDVVESAGRVLTEFNPSWIIESEARHIGEDGVTALFDRMRDAGYDGFFFAPDGLKSLSEFSFEKFQSQEGDRFWDRLDYCNNFLFTKAKQ